MIRLLHNYDGGLSHPGGQGRGIGGVLLSVVLHGAIVFAIVNETPFEPEPDKVMESLVQYLVPLDRQIGTEARRASGEIEFVAEGNDGSGEADQQGTTEGDRPTGLEVKRGGGEPAPRTEEPSAEAMYASMLNDSVHSVVEVDSAVVRDPESAAPAYPPHLLAEQIQGSAFVLYVVDSTGRVDTTSLRVIRATHPDFVTAVREALPNMRFRPALIKGKPVAQLVQQSFAFRITTSTARRDTTPVRRPQGPASLPLPLRHP